MHILHVFRTPVGGLFRHVRDLAKGQSELGHDVGILCDSTSGGEAAVRLLNAAETLCRLGITRIPISRMPGFGDLSGTRQAVKHLRAIRPDIIHCHGAKGGLIGRLAGRFAGIPSIYTPHGGSLHYRWSSPAGAVFLAAERVLARLGSGFHFVCNFEREAFEAKIGTAGRPAAVIYNGLWPEEFEPAVPATNATDLLFIGELRDLKGVDVLITAMALAAKTRPLTATIVGDGPDEVRYRRQTADLGLATAVTFAGRMPASEAFRRGRILVLPSRNESFPYVVLEACAAQVPIIASAVGGIPEVLPTARLVAPGDPDALARRIIDILANPQATQTQAAENRRRVQNDFSAATMVAGSLQLYGKILRT